MSQNKDADEDEPSYPFPLVLKANKRSGSVSSTVGSGQTTPGGGGANGKTAGRQKLLSEGDLQRADEALSHHGGRNGNGY